MCFSATASFSAAAIIGTIGLTTTVSAIKNKYLAALPYAAIPLLFASQQLIEGFLWLDLEHPQAGACRAILTSGFIGTAEVIWPLFAPLSVWLIEPDDFRRRVLFVLTVCGFLLAGWLLFIMISLPFHAMAQEAGIVYQNGYRSTGLEYPVYGLVTTAPFALSSYREVRWFSLVIFAGLAVTLIFYRSAYISVWCFFAAIASALVYWHLAKYTAGKTSDTKL